MTRRASPCQVRTNVSPGSAPAPSNLKMTLCGSAAATKLSVLNSEPHGTVSRRSIPQPGRTAPPAARPVELIIGGIGRTSAQRLLGCGEPGARGCCRARCAGRGSQRGTPSAGEHPAASGNTQRQPAGTPRGSQREDAGPREAVPYPEPAAAHVLFDRDRTVCRLLPPL